MLKGACFFLSDLARAIDLPVEIDFMAVSSYGSATHTSGVVRILKDLDLDLTGPARADRRGHRRLGLDPVLPAPQPGRPPPGVAARWWPCWSRTACNRWISTWPTKGSGSRPSSSSGYGLDAAERYRNLPFVAVYNGEPGQPESGATLGAFMKKVLRSPIAYVVLGAVVALLLFSCAALGAQPDDAEPERVRARPQRPRAVVSAVIHDSSDEVTGQAQGRHQLRGRSTRIASPTR